jgi:glycine hydroxymethyltransferase
MIFYRRGARGVNKKTGEDIPYGLEDKINFAVFPGLQGGPHNHTISGLACALKQAATPEFKQYQEQVMANSTALADGLQKRGYTLVSGGTDNHIVLVDLRPKGVDGSKAERVLELAHIAANKNTVPGDVKAMVPGGLRMGSPALTSRGFVEGDFDQVAGFVDRAVKIAIDVQSKVAAASGKKNVTAKEFNTYLAANKVPEIDALKADVETFSKQFPTIGFEKSTMRYQD